MRIVLMVTRLIYVIGYYIIRMSWMAKHRSIPECFKFIKHVTKRANKAGLVKIEAHGLENLPKENGFVMFPNHQGMFDILVFLESCPVPFSLVYKHELKNIILLKQVFSGLRAIPMNREDLRQSMKVINEMTERVKNGENFVIFAEGTRSRMGNKMLDMKGGSFKSAVRAKCPIVPCALIDSFKPFDEKKSIKKQTVRVFYLEPMYYDEYKEMTTLEIADEVKRRIEKCISENEQFK